MSIPTGLILSLSRTYRRLGLHKKSFLRAPYALDEARGHVPVKPKSKYKGILAEPGNVNDPPWALQVLSSRQLDRVYQDLCDWPRVS